MDLKMNMKLNAALVDSSLHEVLFTKHFRFKCFFFGSELFQPLKYNWLKNHPIYVMLPMFATKISKIKSEMFATFSLDA
jgi:hypothetical protein